MNGDIRAEDMTTRERMALEIFCAAFERRKSQGGSRDALAEMAVEDADALLEALAKVRP